jgi:MFS transporter, DHA2 family, multidrug resistance protein
VRGRHHLTTIEEPNVIGHPNLFSRRIIRFYWKPFTLYRSVHTGLADPAGCIVIVDFRVKSSKIARQWVDELIDASAGMTAPQGMLSAHFHISSDGTRMINYAEWVDSDSHQRSVDRRPQHEHNRVTEVVDQTPGIVFQGFDRFTYWWSKVA